jgi:hypothetical protein
MYGIRVIGGKNNALIIYINLLIFFKIVKFFSLHQKKEKEKRKDVLVILNIYI